jgi:hypothetical protein
VADADTITDHHAHLRLDTHEKEICKHDAAIVKLSDTLVQIDKNSEVRHATSQTQNAAILARLNQPSVVMSILGNPTAVTGIVSLLGSVIAGAVALGYAGAPVRDVPVLVPVPAIESREPAPVEPITVPPIP